jgi:hypothetical protein
MPLESDAAPRPRARFRPRFSLRSLIIFSFLCGAGMWVWREWGPWKITQTLSEGGAILSEPLLDSSDRLHLCIETADANNIARRVPRRDLHSGRVLSTTDPSIVRCRPHYPQ